MRAICVDDEALITDTVASLCRELPQIDEVRCFLRAREAQDWLESNPVDLVLLDIHMPELNGLVLAEEIRKMQPDAAIIFLTAHPEYAVKAFALHVSGYLLKPVDRGKLAAEVAYALSGKTPARQGRLMVHTFGSFDVFVNGQPVSFKMAKCKEMLAYLVDKQGGGVTRAELASILWEDRLYDRKLQKQLDVYIRSLRETLREYGIEDMLEMQKGVLRIRPEQFVCDAYRFRAGDPEAVNRYRGEYMSAYSWASTTESLLYWEAIRQS